MSRCYDTIVIGTGIGGLTSGLALQRQGFSVLLLEAASDFGGLMNPFQRKKFHFDVGVHYLGQAGPGETLRRDLDSLGLEEVQFREIDPDCIDRYVFDGYECRLVKGIERWGDTLAADFPHEERNVRRFIALMQRVDRLVQAAGGGLTLRTLASTLAFTPDLVRLVRLSFRDLLLRYFEDPLLLCAFGGCGGDLGLPPGRMSALGAILLLNYYLGGAHYPIGGSGAIVNAFVKGLKRHGAELQRNQLVERVRRRADGTFEVFTEKGDCFHGRTVISNVDVTHTLDLLDGIVPSRRTRRKAPALRPSLSAFFVFLATDLDLPKLGITDANIWHYPHNDLESTYDELFAGQIPDPPAFFLTAATLKDPISGLAPPGTHLIELLTLAPAEPFKPWFGSPSMRRSEDYQAFKEPIAESLITAAEKYIPGLSQHLLHKESASPATVWHYVRSREAGIYGPEHSPDQYPPRRFLPSIGVPGFYLAGASVFGCGIALCSKSAFVAAGMTSRYLKKERPVAVAVPAAGYPSAAA
ncbi:MAG TPA: NAD(P)/FAD-dependent oxidoreductase [Thermoanaerobaculia bacterium]|nr:NAD(P)/FAD-dependent oxidoreductase [Thermoanaerobaculia bacterium]